VVVALSCAPVAPAPHDSRHSRDDAGEGFNDPTPVAPVGGNSGTTLGEQRRIAFDYAAAALGGAPAEPDRDSHLGDLRPLACSVASTTLGVAGTGERLPRLRRRAARRTPSTRRRSPTASPAWTSRPTRTTSTRRSTAVRARPVRSPPRGTTASTAPARRRLRTSSPSAATSSGTGWIHHLVDVDTGARFQNRDDIFLTNLLDNRTARRSTR
jgi:hypothetical protein